VQQTTPETLMEGDNWSTYVSVRP